MTEQLARTDRLSRLALQSGGMGWYQFDAATGVVSASDELGSILGLPSNMRSARLDAFLGFVAAEDREGVLAAIEQAQLAGHGANEFRWQRPDGEEIWLETTARRFDEADASSQLVGVAKEVTDRKRTEAELRHQASHDPLTGLANRAALLDELKGSLQRGDQVCLLLVDLDGFKDINDSLGHPVGDRVLTQVTRRFHQQLRGGDLLARIGGDEFAVVVHDEIAGAGVLAQNLLSCLALPITLGGVAMNVRASIGISAGGVHGADPHTLLRRADAAMYRAKSRGGAWQVYEPADEASTTRRLELAARLPEALRESELKVEFQPILHVSSGQVARVEALVRWQHPRHGLIMPSEFVPLAEHHGLGSRLFHYVLAHALAQCARWRAEELADIVAVNVSAQTLTSDSFVSALKDALTAAEVPAQALMLELTEESFVKEGPVLKRSIQQVRELGIQVAIDDFGTGYSSLAYLKQLPADCVKLDGTFTSDLSRDSASDAIVGLAIDLAHRLGLTVVTEGVESAAALEALRNLGSDFAQGYLIGVPQDGAALTSALREQRWGA